MKEDTNAKMLVPIFISASDMLDERIRLVVETLGFEEFLYRVGFDRNIKVLPDNAEEELNPDDYTFYQVDFVEHRNRAGVVVKCDRYVGFERLDTEWIKSGNASEMAEIFAKNDPSLLAELKSLGG